MDSTLISIEVGATGAFVASGVLETPGFEDVLRSTNGVPKYSAVLRECCVASFYIYISSVYGGAAEAARRNAPARVATAPHTFYKLETPNSKMCNPDVRDIDALFC